VLPVPVATLVNTLAQVLLFALLVLRVNSSKLLPQLCATLAILETVLLLKVLKFASSALLVLLLLLEALLVAILAPLVSKPVSLVLNVSAPRDTTQKSPTKRPTMTLVLVASSALVELIAALLVLRANPSPR